ncbi:MAG TPA: hypothetical protein DCZ03_03355 [Gammaproteobacteria bacterium]|nr:hypothetical protein [Gammaproteobacteria bacterium]
MQQTIDGFSLIELTLVLVILAIVSATVIPRVNLSDNSVGTQAERLVRDIRHLQSLAMQQETTLTLDISSNSYSVRDAGVIITDPTNQQNFSVTLDYGVTLSGTDTDFDSWARPVSSGVLLTGTRSFTLTGNGGKSITIEVDPVSGFVSVL